MYVRDAVAKDREKIRQIQAESPEAAQWEASDYPTLVTELKGDVAGFLTWRHTAPDEIEILNLAVAKAVRRQGIAQSLLFCVPKCTTFLEVRESNHVARLLYRKAGFIEAGIRFGYYSHPAESGIVMRRECDKSLGEEIHCRMDQNDSEAIRQHLLETDAEYQEIARKHHEFDLLARNEQDETEEHRLKKLKLQLKDQMEGMVLKYKTQTA